MLKKILFGILMTIVVIIIAVIGFVYTSYDKNYSADFPVPDLQVKADSAMIERGRYLAYGSAHCVDCHAPMEEVIKHEGSTDIALTGGFGLEIPPGKFYAPNLTPDEETGIGRYSDGQIYRMLRHNIRPDGQASIDFMPFINMADEDIHAIIAFLRSQEKVKHKMPERELTLLGKFLFAVGAVKPGIPDEPVLQAVKEDTTVTYGKYLAGSVANCKGCHTNRDMKTGEFIGVAYAGGLTFGPDSFTRGWAFHSPNLTPDKETGIIAEWDEESFIDRMKAGRIYETSPMPWGAFQNISDNDLKAIFRYLKSLEPEKNPIEMIATPPVNQ